MIPFFVLSMIILLLSFVKKDKQFYLLIFIGVLLFLIAGFRAESVGTDTPHYKEYFEVISAFGWISIEPGWVLLNKLVQYFGGGYTHFMAIVSVVTILPLLYIFNKYSKNPILSLFFYYTLYIYFYSFNISRQVLATTLVIIALVLLTRSKKIWFIAMVAFASLFHTSALIALPLLFIDRLPNKTIFYILGIIISFIIGLFLTDTLSNYLAKATYTRYIETYEFGNVLGNAMYLIILNAFFIFILLTISQRDIYFKLFFLYVILANILARVPFGGRVLLFYSIFMTLFFPYYLENNKIKEKVVPYLIVIAYAFVVFYRSFGGGEILPYSNILFEVLLIN